jgi:hypothetical protein
MQAKSKTWRKHYAVVEVNARGLTDKEFTSMVKATIKSSYLNGVITGAIGITNHSKIAVKDGRRWMQGIKQASREKANAETV